MSITGSENGAPTKVGPGIGDIVPGIFLAFGILAAVYQAKTSGKGQFVDVAMVTAFWLFAKGLSISIRLIR